GQRLGYRGPGRPDERPAGPLPGTGPEQEVIQAPKKILVSTSHMPAGGGVAGSTEPRPLHVGQGYFVPSSSASVRWPSQVGHRNGTYPRGPASYSFSPVPPKTFQLGIPRQ